MDKDLCNLSHCYILKMNIKYILHKNAFYQVFEQYAKNIECLKTIDTFFDAVSAFTNIYTMWTAIIVTKAVP